MGQFRSLILRRGFSSVYMPTAPIGEQATRLDTVDLQLASGTGNSQCDLLYVADITLAASANSDIRLNNNSIADPFGAALTFVKVRGILIQAAAGNTNDVILKPAAANGFLGPFSNAAHTQNVKRGGTYLADNPVDGWAVGGATHSINLANSAAGTSVTFRLAIIGTSA